METIKKNNGTFKNVIFIYNDHRTESEEIDWNNRMNKAEKYIVDNYKLETDYGVVYAVKDFVIGQITYGKPIPDTNPYLVREGNASTCTGYTDVMADLLTRFGIESRLVTGCAHALNAVKVGGIWYYSDATCTDNIPRK